MNNKSSGIGCLGFILLLPFMPIILPIALILGLFSSSNNTNTKKDNNNISGFTDEELDAYGLWNDEKELVKKGEYDPWDFEENEMLEDDDFYDDDFK